ncbi:MAG: hypothetical protein JWQ09_2970 [Segetibacter sp.]|nr:hypothetical protein [Segetibacter sp.]
MHDTNCIVIVANIKNQSSNFITMPGKETSTIEKAEFSKDLKSLIGVLQFMGEGGNYNTILHDFMIFSFEELVGSNKFIEMDANRRKEMFKQYHELQYVLSNIEEFVRTYPDDSATTLTGSYNEKVLETS